MATAVELIEVTARYRRGGGVTDCTFAASTGERIALFGGPGSGKSTLLRLIAGRLSPIAGSVRTLGASPRRVRDRVGVAAETTPRSLFTPNQLLYQTLVRHGTAVGARPGRVAEMLEMFDLYEERDRPARELSDGQRESLALATALVHHPAVVLLDNLTSRLGRPLARRLEGYIDDSLRAEEMTLIHATTDAGEAEKASRVVVLDRGAVLAYNRPDILVSARPADVVTVEALDPGAVRRTLRGASAVEVAEADGVLRFAADDGIATAAHLLRLSAGDVRAVYVRRPDLWDVVDRLRNATN